MKEHAVIRDLLILAAAGALNPVEERRVEEHLRHCEECRIELNGWTRLAGALRQIPTPQAPSKLVFQTCRLLEARAAAIRARRGNWLAPALLILFSWIAAALNWRFIQLFDSQLSHRLNLSSATLWVVSIGITWLAAGIAACVLAKHSPREGRIL
jgi:anti-sigma factor RsiW